MKKTQFSVVIGLMLVLAPLCASAQADLNSGLEALVRTSFADAPEMISIAKCESNFRQFGPSGAVLRGGPVGQYLGLFQIDENLHTARAVGMGYDIRTAEGNIAYARYLLSRSGTQPWGCAKKIQPAPAATSATATLTVDLRFGMVSEHVLLLQKMLNKNAFPVAASGPGSPGNETMRFGMLTRDAVRRFQCVKHIVCEGNETTTGYGRVGPRTRAALNQIAP